MGLFKKKTKISSDEYQELLKKIVSLVADTEILKVKFENVASSLRSVQAKYRHLKTGEITEEEETENLKYKNFLP